MMIRQTSMLTCSAVYRQVMEDMILNPYWHDLVDLGTTGRVSSFDHLLFIHHGLDPVPFSFSDYRLARWTKFLGDYLDYSMFQDFILQLRKKDGHEKGYTFKVGSHTGGNCLLGVSARIGNDFNQVNLYSRTCIMMPTGVLDMNLLYQIGRILNKIKPQLTTLAWHISELQLHNITTLPYLSREDKIKYRLMNGGAKDSWQQSLIESYEHALSKDYNEVKYKRHARMIRHVQHLEELRKENMGYLPPESNWVPEIPEGYYT